MQATYIAGWGTNGYNVNIGPIPCKAEITDLVVLSDTATTAQITATHYSFQLNNTTQSEDLFAAVNSLVGADLAANVAKAFTTDQNQIVAKNDNLQVQVSATGTGTLTMASAKLTLQVRYRVA